LQLPPLREKNVNTLWSTLEAQESHQLFPIEESLDSQIKPYNSRKIYTKSVGYCGEPRNQEHKPWQQQNSSHAKTKSMSLESQVDPVRPLGSQDPSGPLPPYALASQSPLPDLCCSVELSHDDGLLGGPGPGIRTPLIEKHIGCFEQRRVVPPSLHSNHTGLKHVQVNSKPLDTCKTSKPQPKQARVENTPPKGHRTNIHRNFPSRKPKASRLSFEQDDDTLEVEAEFVEPYPYAKHCKSSRAGKQSKRNLTLVCFFANISSVSIKTQFFEFVHCQVTGQQQVEKRAVALY